jgi:hypothetical protein
VVCAAPSGQSQPKHLQISGTHFTYADGRPFTWRGISAFRLLEMEASGRGADVDAYLRWASSQKLTVVRVLAMAKHLFELPPDRGAAALDGLLDRASRRNLIVEVVALADTAAYTFDMAAHVRRIAEICLRHPNALLEIANEPYHPTQRSELHDRNSLVRLRREVPAGLPVALGAGAYPERHAEGDYVTIHFPRSSGAGGWATVRDLAAAAEIVRDTGKPVINDEPIGAGPRFEPGRRDDDPERFRAAALMSRLIGIGATFHYEGGLQAKLPAGREMQCFQAWQEAWSLMPEEALRVRHPSNPGASGSPVAGVRGTFVGAYTFADEVRAWLLVIGAQGSIEPVWRPEWKVQRERRWAHSYWGSASRVR